MCKNKVGRGQSSCWETSPSRHSICFPQGSGSHEHMSLLCMARAGSGLQLGPLVGLPTPDPLYLHHREQRWSSGLTSQETEAGGALSSGSWLLS